MSDATGPLHGIRVLDLSRVLAAPYCTQLLGDLGADVIKVERPGKGDDTRTWGPPNLKTPDGEAPLESGYYMCTNRNKRSVTIDLAGPRGQALVKALARRSDVLLENYKVGALARYGLAFEQLHAEIPRLVYCSVTGFGQTGPYAPRPGYDLVAQGMGGIMSITGEADGPPVKVPVAINDIMTGLYASVAILAALRHRDATGLGQHIDLGLLDVQVSWLANQAMNYLMTGAIPQRLGSAHPNVVPYQAFPTRDGHVVLGVGNDEQFARFAAMLGEPGWATDPRFSNNAARAAHRVVLLDAIAARTSAQPASHWLAKAEAAGLPCSPVNTVDQVFADPQVQHRGMKVTMPHPLSATGTVDLVGNPIKLSATPVAYRRYPPRLGEHTDEVLAEVLGLSAKEREALRAEGVV